MAKVADSGVDMEPTVTSFKDQKYNAIRKGLLAKGELFVDDTFPATSKSLFVDREDNDIEWKRPKELCESPKLVVDGVGCDDLVEGDLGNTWFVSACASLARDMRLWKRVVPDSDKQDWTDAGDYAGIFHFQFWRYGQWVDVVVDDLLPSKDGQLIFCHSNSKNEFWSALIEKAYAKLYGSYGSLSAGHTADALVDFTGGVAEQLDMTDFDPKDLERKDKFFMDVMTAAEQNALIVCHIWCKADDIGHETERGLLKGHGYLVRQLLGIQVPKALQPAIGQDRLQLIRLTNPWGTHEWNGPWSDDSREWKALSDKDRESIGIKFEAEGDFWMSIYDFVEQFSQVDICYSVNTAIFSTRKTWNEKDLHGRWQKGYNGGGIAEKTFLCNPQYMFDVEKPSDKFILSLEQEDTVVGEDARQKLMSIGFVIMKVEQNREFRLHAPGDEIASTDYHENRNVFRRLNLKRGRYVVVPSTELAGQMGVYLLRIYSGGGIAVRQLEEHCPENPTGCCAKPYMYVAQVNVVGAAGLHKSSKPNTPTNPFVIVTSGTESVRSAWANRTEDPTWNFKTIFYLQKSSSRISIEVMNHRQVSDDCLGIAHFSFNSSKERQRFTLSLEGNRKTDKGQRKSGKLKVEVVCSPDLLAL